MDCEDCPTGAEWPATVHAFYMNEGILIRPFHGMLLTCATTAEADVAAHGGVFERFVGLVCDAGVP